MMLERSHLYSPAVGFHMLLHEVMESLIITWIVILPHENIFCQSLVPQPELHQYIVDTCFQVTHNKIYILCFLTVSFEKSAFLVKFSSRHRHFARKH